MEENEKYMPDKLTIHSHNIIGIVNYAWERSFARVKSNKKAVAERRWFPYNHNLMTNPLIRVYITEEESALELLETSTVILPLQTRVDLQVIIDSQPTFDPKFIIPEIDEAKKAVNFSTGTAAFFLDKLVQHNELHAARNRMKRYKEVA